ncbi:MAG: gliding motility-associated C-terminal domain-containing protein, partial [Bacteroidales bacterium]|nr:gliding motility-associated C-terminal domain-containing protein [Bacteroidales bacterium]
GPTVEEIAALYTDNCGGDITVTKAGTPTGDDCSWSVTYSYTVRDKCNNYVVTVPTVTYSGGDRTAPEFTVPSAITICRDVTCAFDASPSITGDVYDESDNCSVGIEAIPSDDLTNLPSCDTAGYILRKWTLTDNCGNATTQYQIIWVQPVPQISVEVPDTLFCNGATVDFTIDSLVISRGEVMYDFEVNYPGGVSGNLSDGSRQIADISDVLVNSTDSHQTVTYTFRPYIQGKPGDPTCHDGVEVTILIHVEPTARVALTLGDDELCNGESVNIQLSTVTVPYHGIEFNVDAINNYPEISGYTDRTGLSVTDLITEALTNSGDTVRLVTYVVSPVTLDVSGNQKCYGINDTVRVWVNPTPRATPLNNNPHICYGETTDIVLLSPTVMSSGVNEFNYTITATADNTIVDGNRDPMNSVAPGTSLQFSYTNESDTMQSVFFRITPKVTGPGCPYGPRVVSEVKVHAHPLQSLEIRDSITCHGGQNGTLEVIPAKGVDPLWVKWTGPDYWEDEGYNMFIVDERRQGNYTATVTDNLGCSSVGTLSLLEPYTEVAFYFNKYISCPGANDAQITLALTEGEAPPYNYYIMRDLTDTVYQGPLPPQNFPPDPVHIDSVAPGEYLLIVEDANGCKLPELRTLFDAPVTEVKFGKSDYSGYNISCEAYNDGSIWVSSIRSYYLDGADTIFVKNVAPYSYHWTDSAGVEITGSPTDSILVGVPAGAYHLTVTTSKGCTFSFTDVLTEPDGIDLLAEDISLSPDGNYQISCYGRNDGYIDLQFDGGTGGYTYSWTGPEGFTATTASIASLYDGTYDLTVTDGNGCHRYYQYILDEPDSVGISVLKSLTGDGLYNISCNGEDGQIDITVTGGSGPGTYAYDWKNNNNPEWSSNLEDLSVKAGSYRVYVTDANGCTTDRGVELTQPLPLDVSTMISNITCLTAPVYNDGVVDLTIDGGKGPYSYLWTGPSGYTSTEEDISGLTPGDYNVRVTDDYGCIIDAEAHLSLPEPLTVDRILSDYNGFNVSCLGRADGWLKIIPVTGTAPCQYSWNGPDGFTAMDTDSIYGLREGTYTITVTDNNMCNTVEETTLVSPGQLSLLVSKETSEGGNYNINCNGEATGRVDLAAINAAGTASYLWSGGVAGANRDDLRASEYEVIVTDGNGCSADTTLTLTEPDPIIISFSMVSPYCPESTDGTVFAGVTGGEGAYSFLWNSGQTTQEITGLTAGLYIVDVSDYNGCTAADSVTLAPLSDMCVGIPNAFSPDGDGINEYWVISKIALYSEAEVVIVNRWGEMVWKSEKGYPDPWDGRASNGRELPMDSYHYAIDLHNSEKPIVGHVTIIR